jgi:hypothetical protein
MINSIYRRTLYVLILFAASAANAGIYKCSDADGQVMFSDKACDTNVNTIELKSLNTPAPEEKPAYSDKSDLRICPGGHGTILPEKLCDDTETTGCRFRSDYLRNIITDIGTLRNDISDAQVDLIEKNIRQGSELWEFSAPDNEWDAGTGIRGYVVISHFKPVFYMVALYQGLPNKPPNGDVRYLPLEGRYLKACKDRTIMDSK